MPTHRENFGRNITFWLEREERQKTWLARKLGVSRTQVYKWADGENIPGGETLEKLAELTGLAVPFWLMEDGIADPFGAIEKLRLTLQH